MQVRHLTTRDVVTLSTCQYVEVLVSRGADVVRSLLSTGTYLSSITRVQSAGRFLAPPAALSIRFRLFRAS